MLLKQLDTHVWNRELRLLCQTQIISKGIMGLNVRAKTVKLPEVCFLVWLCIRKGLLDMTPKVGPIRENISKLDFAKIKNFCISKDSIRKWKDKPQLKNFCSAEDLLKRMRTQASDSE